MDELDYNPLITVNEEGLNDREVQFLNILFDECQGDVSRAMKSVGYPSGTSSSVVTKRLNKQIKERAKDYLIANSGRAAISLVTVLQDPSAVGAKNLIAASKDILDRSGIFKEETPQITEVRNMFILPAKDSKEDEEDE